MSEQQSDRQQIFQRKKAIIFDAETTKTLTLLSPKHYSGVRITSYWLIDWLIDMCTCGSCPLSPFLIPFASFRCSSASDRPSSPFLSSESVTPPTNGSYFRHLSRSEPKRDTCVRMDDQDGAGQGGSRFSRVRRQFHRRQPILASIVDSKPTMGGREQLFLRVHAWHHNGENGGRCTGRTSAWLRRRHRRPRTDVVVGKLLVGPVVWWPRRVFGSGPVVLKIPKL